MAAEGQSDRLVSDTEVCMEQRCVIEFLHALAKWLWRPNSGCEHRVVVWVVHFSSGNSDSGLPPLLQIFMSMACRLLFITGKNVQLMVVTVEKWCFVVENLLYQIVLVCFLEL